MVHSYDEKFKDRYPQQTVNIIKQFFQDRGYSLIIPKIEYKEESSTWSCHCQLLLNNKVILTSNGKGTSKEYCLASGHAELYERFCNKIFCMGNPFVINKFLKENFKNKGYYFSPEEKLSVNFEDHYQVFNKFLSFAGSSKSQVKSFFDLILDNQYIGVPYKNAFDSQDSLYLDPRVVCRIIGSTGMAAGNSFYEAFNQGASEICEHYIRKEFLFYNDKEFFHEIDLNLITNLELKNIINSIKKSNDIHIYDMSYNCGFPVLLSVLVNHTTHNITTNIGAFPVFDIALERVLTELYQGSRQFSKLKTDGIIPFNSQSEEKIIVHNSSTLDFARSFPEHIFLNSKFNQPSEIFIYGNYSNEEIFTYYKDLFKRNNLSIYYGDMSQIDDMCAIHIIAPEIDGFIGLDEKIFAAANIDLIYDFIFKMYRFINKIIQHDYSANFYELGRIFNRLTAEDIYCAYRLIFNPWTRCGYEFAGNREILKVACFFEHDVYFNDDGSNLLSDFKESLYYQQLIKYIILFRYKNAKYNIDSIKNIFEYLNIELTQEDLDNYNNKYYLSEKIVYDTIFELYNNFDYISSLIGQEQLICKI